jgi:hypothetical protein
VRPFLVAIGHPIGEFLAGVRERREQRLVEQLVTKQSVSTKAFCSGSPGAT